MPTLKTRFLVSDLDDTLLTSEKKISDLNKASIEQFRNAGGLFTIATGRCIPEALEYIQELQLTIPAILGNGAITYDPIKKDVTILDQLSEETVQNILQHAKHRAKNVDILIYTPTEIYTSDLQYLDPQYFAEYYSRVEILSSFDELPSEDPVLKIVAVTDPSQMDLVWEWAKQLNLPIDFVQSSERYFEILPENVSKGNAVEKLLHHLKIPLHEAAAVGDHMNDVSMLQKVGKSFAVANAHPTTIQTANQIVPSHNNSAIHHIIQEYLLTDLREAK